MACELAWQESRAPCRTNETFGCTTSGVWVAKGCRGKFTVGGETLECGFPSMSPRKRYDCEVSSPHTVVLSSQNEATACTCQNGRIASSSRCHRPRTNATWACSGGSRGGALADCCAYDSQRGCASGWQLCRWHGEERIAWPHVPKCVATLPEPSVAGLPPCMCGCAQLDLNF